MSTPNWFENFETKLENVTREQFSRFQIPENFEVQIRSRSGLAIKNGVFCLNGIGTIDSGYRSEYGVILANFGDEVFEIKQGDRIAQVVLAKVSLCEWNEVDNLDKSERGEGGFGHSGTK